MLTLEEANKLMTTFINLRDKAQKTKSTKDLNKFRQHERICVEKFFYIVKSKTARYKSFSNYDDLNQEGIEALVRGLKTYCPDKGNIFWWLHRYADTRISRSANLHTTIRFPLKYTKKVIPHRETSLPILIDMVARPDALYEQMEAVGHMKNNLSGLSSSQKQVVNMIFGIDGENPQSMTKVCQKLHISKLTCEKILDQAFVVLRKNMRV